MSPHNLSLNTRVNSHSAPSIWHPCPVMNWSYLSHLFCVENWLSYWINYEISLALCIFDKTVSCCMHFSWISTSLFIFSFKTCSSSLYCYADQNYSFRSRFIILWLGMFKTGKQVLGLLMSEGKFLISVAEVCRTQDRITEASSWRASGFCDRNHKVLWSWSLLWLQPERSWRTCD